MRTNDPGASSAGSPYLRPPEEHRNGSGTPPGGSAAAIPVFLEPVHAPPPPPAPAERRDRLPDTPSTPEADARLLPSLLRDAPAPVHVDSDEAEHTHGIHDLLKSVDVWFAIEVQQVEAEAQRLAREWAEEGLPRHDVQRDEPLEPEVVLAGRCAQIYSDWVRRVRTRVEDAAEGETQRVAQHLGAFRKELEQLEASRRELVDTEQQLAEHERALRAHEAEQRARSGGAPSRLAYSGDFRWYWFWPMMLLLIGADFIANVPVFSELLPTSPMAEQLMREWEADAAESPFTFGIQALGARLLVHPEAAILALSVITFFVFLGHALGGGLRSLVALRSADATVAAHARVHRRRPWVSVAFSGVGIVVTLAVLFFARDLTERMAAGRVVAAQGAVAATDSLIAEATVASDMGRVVELEAERAAQVTLLEEREQRHEYTTAIQVMNWPVLGLNLVLIIAAIVAAYHRQSEAIDLMPGAAVGPPAPVDARAGLRARILAHRQAVREMGVAIENGLGRVQHLLHARPLAEWPGRAERLQRVIPLFRGENARHRHTDPWTILAFRREPPLALPAVDAEVAFRAPQRLPALLEEFAALRGEFRKVDDRIASTFGDLSAGEAA